MEQLNNNAALAMLQAIAGRSQPQASKTGKSDKDSDFQKLMDKTSSSSKDSQVEDTSKTETPVTETTEEAPAEQEDALTRIKKMLEQNGNAVAFKPDSVLILLDRDTGQMTASYNPGEWVMVVTDEGSECIPITGLEPWQEAQLNQLLLDPQPIDASDPRVDAMLEATAPGADNSPAALLEKVTADQFGKVIDQAVDGVKAEAQPQTDEEGDGELLLGGGDQAPQQLFHDVEAPPVKVGDVYQDPETEANVAKQVDTGLAQALEKGDSMVRIQLNPEHLGSVTVEITHSAEGIIHVALNAHSSETRSLLERHAGELQNLVASRTQQEVEVNVQRQQESQQGQNQNYDGHNGHAQDGRERRRQQQEQDSGQDFIQQLRLGLITTDAE